MRTIKIGALALALTIATAPLAARALNFTLPPIIPDICPFVSSCITWTQSGTLLAVQQYLAMVQNFRNIHNLGGLQGAGGQVAVIVQRAQAAPPMQSGVTAAQQTVIDSPTTTTRITAIDAQAQAADGIQQHEQVAEAYQSTIASEQAKTNALLSEHETQQAARDNDAIANILEEAGPETQSDPGSAL
jgi:hypothetical protein